MDTEKLYTNLYINHENESILSSLTSALENATLDKESTLEFAGVFNPQSAPLVEKLYKPGYVSEFNFEPHADEEDSYTVLHLEQDKWGDSAMVHFIDFLYALIPGIHAQAWGYTEDEPWEFFIKYEHNRAIKQEHVPWEDEKMDADALEYIYKWWHEDMPDEIEAGLLNDEFEEEEDEFEQSEFDPNEFDDEE